ncbi:MAG TPA: hypothetical protein VHI52_01170 [Verrucomicrobiae bacterium]|nr:hypothetical protein [Verrucomicrobiae bacterium]
MNRYAIAATLALRASAAPALAQGSAQPSPAGAGSCPPSNGMNYLCNFGTEDMLQIPGTKYILTGGTMGRGGGYQLLDTDAKTSRTIEITAKPNPTMYPDCPAPDMSKLNAHGTALRPTRTPGLYSYYTVTHSPVESVQVYSLDARGALPTLAWVGCTLVHPDDLRGNGVTATMDGTIYLNVQLSKGHKAADYYVGQVTGGLYQWKPADKTWRLVPGTEFPGNNGVEIAKDEKEIYLAVSGTHSVEIFSLGDHPKFLRRAALQWFNVDNIHWSGDKLLTAGQMEFEPACGGTRKQTIEKGLDINCHRGWVVAEINPATGENTVLAYNTASPAFGGAATAQIVGGNIWLTSTIVNTVGWVPVPVATQKAKR